MNMSWVNSVPSDKCTQISKMNNRNNKKKVDIVANSVLVHQANSKPKNNNNNKTNKRRKNKVMKKLTKKMENLQIDENIAGTITDMGTQIKGVSYKTGANGVLIHPSYGECNTLSDNEASWLQHYLDPCGEKHFRGGGVRVPDGALPFSCEVQPRFVDTITFPFTNISVVDQTGRNFSMLCMLTPLFRGLAIVVINSRSLEFGDIRMKAFNKAWSTIQNRTDILFPNWFPFIVGDEIEVETAENFITVLSTTAFDQLLPPDLAGNSPIIQQFRITGMGMEVLHNTPTLFDQATVVVGRFNASTAMRAAATTDVAGYNPIYLRTNFAANNFLSVTASIPGGFTPPSMFVFNFAGTIAPGGFTPIFIAEAPVRNAGLTFQIAIGDEIRYTHELGRIYMQNVTTSSRLELQLGIPGLQGSTRIYYSDVIDLEDQRTVISEFDPDLTVIGLPPTTQADIIQQNPLAYQTLLKDNGGVYFTNQIWQPVFNMTNSTGYRKVVFNSLDQSLVDLADPDIGWFDSVDTNFGFTIANFQSVPYAAAPMIKCLRTDEWVPSPHSIIGMMTFNACDKNEVAVLIAQDFMNKMPHAMPKDFNTNGKLFGMISGLIRTLPVALSHGVQISKDVAKLVQDVVSTYNGKVSKRDNRLVY
jgi:hypothetical protein